MAKYCFEFKKKVVQEYLSGFGGYGTLAKKHSVKTGNQVARWVSIYQELGESGLLRSKKNRTYSVQFKLDTIQLYQTSELSYREVANIVGLNNPALIANWSRKLQEWGIDGLSSTKGRPPKMPKKKKAGPKELSPEQERIQELEKKSVDLKSKMPF